MVNARTQPDIIGHPFFAPFIDSTKSFASIEEVFTKKQLRELAKELESSQPVHEPWTELIGDDNFSWSPLEADFYMEPEDGGKFGPS